MDSQVTLLLNSVWVVVAAILVFFMQAGFALVESGLVRAKNAVNVIMKNFCDMCVGGIGFWVVGYGLMFGSASSGWFGTDKFCLNHAEPFEFTLIFFQMMFAATAATIVSGALAERIRFNAYLIGSLLITSLIYPIIGCWAWNPDGWLKMQGFRDFAGSTVVHSVGAWCALAGILVLGPRLGRFAKDGTPRLIPGHNLPLVALGGMILWFGWFGFNAGSTGAADGLIGKIALNTHLSACAAVAGIVFLGLFTGKPPFLAMIVNCGLGGLVSITAGCANVTPGSAILIGFGASMLVPMTLSLLDSYEIDDAVGAIAVHGACGVWGTLSVALFDEAGFEWEKLGVQAIGCAVAFLVVFPVAAMMYAVIGSFSALRVRTIDEQRGLDFAEHHEVGYPEFQDQLLHGGTAPIEPRFLSNVKA